MTAATLLKRNIDTMLKARNQTRHDLAFWCRKSDAWLSRILDEKLKGTEARGLPLKYLDRIADFFGITAYQLFQPGISAISERRSGRERRGGADRRIGRSTNVRTPLPADVATLSADELSLLRRVRQLKYEQWGHVNRWVDATLLSQGIAPDTPARGSRGRKGGTREPGSDVPPPK